MDILLHLQSAKWHKMIYGCVEDVPSGTLLSADIDLNFARRKQHHQESNVIAS